MTMHLTIGLLLMLPAHEASAKEPALSLDDRFAEEKKVTACMLSRIEALDDKLSDPITIGRVVAYTCKPSILAMLQANGVRYPLPFVNRIDEGVTEYALRAAQYVLLSRRRGSVDGIYKALNIPRGDGEK